MHIVSKVFIRHASPVQQDQIQYLNIDQNITALCSHPEHPAAVVLGTTSHLLIYDIAENKTVMSKEVQSIKYAIDELIFKLILGLTLLYQIENGVGAVVIGSFDDSDQMNVIVGGNCFLQCFNMEGSERYWNVMSDQVSALALIDFDGDGHNHV